MFSGLSSPEDLKAAWENLKSDLSFSDNFNIIWDYKKPEQLKPGFNIVNILYDEKDPNETGHYCLITILPEGKKTKKGWVEFFNPIANHTLDQKEKIYDLFEYFTKKGYDVYISTEGTQTEESSNCGYHCLTHAYNLYVKYPELRKDLPKIYKKIKINDDFTGDVEKQIEGGADNGQTVEEKLNIIIKLLRGIYFGNKYGYELGNSKKGRGVYDIPSNQKEMKYSELKQRYKDYVQK